MSDLVRIPGAILSGLSLLLLLAPILWVFQYSLSKKTNTSTLLQIAILSGDDGQITTLWMHRYYSHSPNPILFIFCAFQLIKIGLSSISAQL